MADLTSVPPLLNQDGEKTSLADFRGRKVLVYFFPSADTPGCTTQSCGLRDVRHQLGDAVIIGISPDKPTAKKKFDSKYGLGFPLLSRRGPRRGGDVQRLGREVDVRNVGPP